MKLDLLDYESITTVLDQTTPTVVVHCAANRFPDLVEADPAAAQALNVDSTRTLARECQTRGILLLYISTDYVFAGRKGEAPYKSDDAIDPPNTYGKTKADGEKAALQETAQTQETGSVNGIVLRVPVLYGHCEEEEQNKSAVHAVLDSVRKAQSSEAKVKVDDWSLRFPTATEDVARVIVDLADKFRSPSTPATSSRIFQFSGQEQWTKYEMARFFAEDVLAMPMDNIVPQNPEKEDGAGAVNRPYNTQLDTSELQILGIDISTLSFKGWW